MTSANEIVTNVIHELAAVIAAADLGAAAGTAPLSVVKGFPRERELSFPALSIISVGRADRRNVSPYVIDETEVDADHVRVDVVRARYTIDLQLDLWTTSKTDRYKLIAQMHALFNGGDMDDDSPDLVPHGISLTLTDSNDAPARVVLFDPRRDDEDTAGQGTFREMFAAAATTKYVTRHTLQKAAWSAESEADVNLDLTFT